MAEINVERKPAGNYTAILAAVAVVLIAGFMWWLGANSEPTSGPVVVEEEDTTEVMAGMRVTLTDLQAPGQYVGQEIRVADVPVSSRMGTQAFWAQLPNEQPFLMKLDGSLVAGGERISGGETVSITGTLHAMSDSVLNAWQSTGAIADEVERQEAQFAQHFVQVTALRRGASGGQQQPAGGR